MRKHRRRKRQRSRKQKAPLSQLPSWECRPYKDSKVQIGEGFELPKRSKNVSSFNYLKAVWRELRRTNDCLYNLSVPAWYTATVGIPKWYLSQPSFSKRMDDERRNLALVARMNYVLDFMVPQNHNRIFRRFVKIHGPIYDGSYRPIMGDCIPPCAYATRPDYSLVHANNSVIREFVNLCPIAGPPTFGGARLCKARQVRT